MSDLPVFKSQFLNRLSQGLAARRKSLKHHGKLTWETEQPDDFEWLSVYFTPLVGDYCIFQFADDHRVSIYVRSKKRANRGKTLLTIEDIRVVDNARDIVAAMETTINESGSLQSDSSQEAVSVIRGAWSRVEIRVANGLN